MVAVEDAEVASRLEARRQQDFLRARAVRWDEWKYRPLGARLGEILFYRLRRLL